MKFKVTVFLVSAFCSGLVSGGSLFFEDFSLSERHFFGSVTSINMPGEHISGGVKEGDLISGLFFFYEEDPDHDLYSLHAELVLHGDSKDYKIYIGAGEFTWGSYKLTNESTLGVTWNNGFNDDGLLSSFGVVPDGGDYGYIWVDFYNYWEDWLFGSGSLMWDEGSLDFNIGGGAFPVIEPSPVYLMSLGLLALALVRRLKLAKLDGV